MRKIPGVWGLAPQAAAKSTSSFPCVRFSPTLFAPPVFTTYAEPIHRLGQDDHGDARLPGRWPSVPSRRNFGVPERDVTSEFTKTPNTTTPIFGLDRALMCLRDCKRILCDWLNDGPGSDQADGYPAANRRSVLDDVNRLEIQPELAF